MTRTLVRAAACVIVVASAIVLPAAGQQLVFRSGVDVVRVDVLVTSRGRPVKGLTAADFEVKDNGVVQNVELATTAGGVNLVLVLDTSSSVRGDKLRNVKEASVAVLRALRPGDSATLIVFAGSYELLSDRTSDFESVQDAIATVEAAGHTAVRDAVYAGLSLASDMGRSLLILFTDGVDNSSWLSESSLLDAVRRSQVTAYVVSVVDFDPRAERFVKGIAERSAGEMFRAEQQKLAAAFMAILEEYRDRYLITYTPSGVRRDDGWHDIGVRLKGKSGRVKARPGYFATGGATR